MGDARTTPKHQIKGDLEIITIDLDELLSSKHGCTKSKKCCERTFLAF